MKLDKDPRDFKKKVVGDIVEVVIPPLVIYFLDYDTKKMVIPTNDLRDLYEVEDLIENSATIVEIDLDISFKCIHCPDTHHHDCVIYYPHNQKKYYTTLNNLRLVERN